MATSINIPALNHAIRADIPAINEVIKALAKNDPSVLTDLESGTKRIVNGSTGWEIQQFNGTSWTTLSDFNINAQKVDSFSASQSVVANTIPVRDADGKLPGDITGNAATASKAKELSETNPIATGGTGGTTPEQARENLGTPPKTHASTSTDYGSGSPTQYGHLKSHDEPDAALTAAGGHALSPAGGESLRTLITEEVAKCLKTSGGVMTGTINLSGNGIDNISHLELTGSGNGGYIDFHYDGSSQDYTTRIIEDAVGHLSIDAQQGVHLNNNSVLTSAGGILNGMVQQSIGDVMAATTDDRWTSIKGGINHESGGSIILYGADHAGQGSVVLGARSRAGGSALSFFADGHADINGNLILTSAGGSMAGNLVFTDFPCMSRDRADSALVLLGGTNYADGSFIQLFGKKNGGTAELVGMGADGTTHHLQVSGDGRCVFRDSRVITGDGVVTGEVSGKSFTLPSGGTWRYLAFTHNDVYVYDPTAGQAAGGTTITINYGYPVTIVYIAVRIA